jgi:rubredoxin
MYMTIMQSEQWIEQQPREPFFYPDFALTYYEGFSRYRDRLWLGIYRRDELFTAAFLMDICNLCLQTKIAQLYSTPWKSVVIQGILPGERKGWDIILGRHGINVRHSLCELSWQVEDFSEEGLSLKHYLVRQFDRDDIRTFGLCFAIQLKPGTRLFGLVLIRKQTPGKGAQRKALDRYDILYRKDFDACSEEYVLLRKDVEKDQLATYLKSLCKYFYECKAGEDMILHHLYRQREDPSPEQAGNGIGGASRSGGGASSGHGIPSGSGEQYCIHCLTVYDPALGDPDAQVPAGTDFCALDEYACPVCGSDKSAFVPMSKPLALTRSN